jgi:hypothetical protein
VKVPPTSTPTIGAWLFGEEMRVMADLQDGW